MAYVFELKWGVISTGRIAGCFVRDALVDPKTRGVNDIVHTIAAVASRSVQKAQEFINKEAHGDPSIKAYGSYQELYADQNVQAIYIGTPHTSHYENARDALLAKKNVLCEKPVTVNAAELKSLITIAKENNVFFMEAMWTRFQPIMLEFKKIVEEGKLGVPVMLHADLSGDFDVENIPKTHRILDPALGGGAILDLGPYPLVWAIAALYEHPLNKKTFPTHISGSMLKTRLTNVDSSTSFTVNFSAGDLNAQASMNCSINLSAPNPGVLIRYRNGNILINAPIFCPKSFTVQYFEKPGSGKIVHEETKEFKHEGGGWHFQADEVAKCVRDGKLQSELWGHDKSLLEMSIFDEVRRQGDYKFPEGVEKVV